MVVGFVHGTFRRLERAADWLTGRAGPYFVGIGFSLLVIGGASFFAVMLPIRAPAPAPLASLFDTHSPLHVLLGIVPTFFACFRRPYAGDMLLWLGSYGACAYILYMIAWAYMMACLEPAGNPVLGLGDNLKERRLGPGSGVWWARFRERAALASGPPLRRQQQQKQQQQQRTASQTSFQTASPPPMPEFDFEPASPIRLGLNISGSNSSSRRGSGDVAPNGGSEGNTRRNSFARVSASLSTLLRPVVGSSHAVYEEEDDEHQSTITGTGTACLPRAPTPGASMSGRKSGQGHRAEADLQISKSFDSSKMQIPLMTLPSKPGRTPDLEASAMTEPFPALQRPTALKGSPAFSPHFSDEPSSMTSSTPPPGLNAAPVLVRPTPIYPDTSDDAFDLELDSEDLFPMPAKMCTKCKPVPLYVAIASLPPEMRKVEKMLRVAAREREFDRLRDARRGNQGGRGSGAGTPDGRPGGAGNGRSSGGKGKGKNKRNRGGRSGGGGAGIMSPSTPDAFLDSSSPSALLPDEATFLPHYALQETDDDEDDGEADIRAWLGEEEAMQLVPPPKPERSHHCSVCKTCVIKFSSFAGAGVRRNVGAKYRPFSAQNDGPIFRSYTGLNFAPPIDDRIGLGASNDDASLPHFAFWTRIFVLLSLLVCALMGFAVATMLLWHMFMVGKGETTVESHDNGYYRKLARRRGQRFMNVYDVGFMRNLLLFFSLGPGSPHSFITIFLPLRIPPYSDGWHYAKRRGLGGRHAGIVPVEELTDDEGETEDSSPSPGPVAAAAGPASPVMTAVDDSVLTTEVR
ncbi:unnamed protein product [Tilletia laevis]|uniref:Protein S-acyltransferase n=1 Tax=Tilletia laevis TaxID=157183 RepID=A0A9N8LBR2_9BASI|nr:unnamed protein product [Tilletia laevis]